MYLFVFTFQSALLEDGVLRPARASVIIVTMVVYVMIRLESVFVDLDSWDLTALQVHCTNAEKMCIRHYDYDSFHIE